jgi:menaquinol-cytochrome c reductase cytochrome b/c subunit
VLSYFVDAPLEEIANPAHPTNPAKAPWYFLWLQELVALKVKLPLGGAAFWGGVVIPTVFVIFLVVLPYLDRKPVGVGVWFAKERRGITILFTIGAVFVIFLIILGYFFRGPNWQLVWPWTEY